MLFLVVLTTLHPTELTSMAAAPRLSDWMGDLLPLLGNATLFDLSLVGTHDTASQRMTTTISDNCAGLSQAESAAAHDVTQTKAWVDTAGRAVQGWSIVQSMSLVDQLNAGVRYIDFRMVWTAAANASSSAPHDFYCNHRVQTAEKAVWYLAQLKDWMVAHPSEVVRIVISRHGGPSWPYTPNSALQRFFAQFTSLFASLLHNHTQFPSATTSIATLVQHGQRLVASIKAVDNVTAAQPKYVRSKSPLSTRESAREPLMGSEHPISGSLGAAACYFYVC